MGAIEIKGMKLGEGAPKTIISIMGANLDECLANIEAGKEAGVECYEWRGDFNDDRYDNDKMVEMGKAISAALPDNPLLFTFRSVSQGGQDTMTVPQYVSLNKALI